MSLFFGDFSTEDTLAPLAVVDGLMFFSCPACGACVVDREYFQTSRNLHEAWHEHTENRFAKFGEALTLIADRFEAEDGAHPDVPERDYEQYPVADPDAALMEAAKESNRDIARAMEQRMLDQMRAPDPDTPTINKPEVW